MLVDKSKKNCHIIDVAIPEDSGVKEKEAEKVGKYQNLARELRGMREVKTKVDCRTNYIGGFGKSAMIVIEGQLKGYRSRQSSNTLIQKSTLLG